jgi:TatD DNase family protein
MPGAMTAKLIDSHAHVTFEGFADDLDGVLARAAAAGVDLMLNVGTDLPSSERARDFAHAHPQVFAAAGIHPHEADAFDDADWPKLEALWADPHVRGVGETGLDYFYDHSKRERQRALFRRHLEAAGPVGRPVIIHCRDAFDDLFALVGEVGLPAGGVLHCFTGGPAEAERAVAMGLHVSFAGILTFKNAEQLREAAARVPADRLLVETDCPFLAPVPHRGKRNEPAYVVETARKLAELRGVSYGEVCALTHANTVRLFGL